MPAGSIKKFFADKGFGFIAADDGSGDIFAHKRCFQGNEGDIRDGMRVTFTTTMDDRSGKPKAESWSLDGGGGGGGCQGGGGRGQGQQPGPGTGTLKKFFHDKGFGFITPDDGGGDFFAPARTFSGFDPDIREGMKVTYDLEVDDRTGKPRASRWSGASGGGCCGSSGCCGGGCASYGGQQLPYGAPQAAYGAQGVYGAVQQQPMGGDNRYSPYGSMSGCSFGAMQPAGFGGVQGQGVPQLPVGWETAPDPSTGKPYYFNRSTGESSWTPPAMPVQMQPPPVAMAPPPQVPSLPAGWEQAVDPTTGKQYYFNRATNETTWDRPQ